MNINHSKLGLVIRICQCNPCQPLSALWTPFVFEMRIFIQTALSLTEFHVLFVLLLLNRINVYLLSHRRNRYFITYQIYKISNTYIIINNYYVLRIRMHKLAIFSVVLLLYWIYWSITVCVRLGFGKGAFRED